MPFPRWLAHVNKRVFNPIEDRRGVRPVLIHTGRTSGRTYRTPLDAHRVPDGYVFIPMYGPRTDWGEERPGHGPRTTARRRP